MDKKDYTTSALAAIGVSIGSVALLFLGMLYGGFVTMKLWNGIISPTFGLVQLNFFQAWGLDVFVSYLISGAKKSDEDSSLIYTFVRVIVATTAFWLIGILIMNFI
ncbi:hypothetical protein P7H00_12560 [Enterococcus pseudoavium]|uniref:Uncharacterized protein n=1 Tax=Enterococcus pseudoavium TaxID=44007 RepID=A0AAE4L756_9ENTE|nr:hypothetical protein [Enterococcus pseudoavium]MDT2737942.1 hypothetical protein [Enterococcus pseudoavium]